MIILNYTPVFIQHQYHNLLSWKMIAQKINGFILGLLESPILWIFLHLFEKEHP